MPIVHIADHGPKFTGWSGRTKTGRICVLSPHTLHSETAQAAVREMIMLHGGDCHACAGCHIGKEEWE